MRFCNPVILRLSKDQLPLVAVAGSATVRRRACAGYLGDSLNFAQEGGFPK
jgi:hypothetical protein